MAFLELSISSFTSEFYLPPVFYWFLSLAVSCPSIAALPDVKEIAVRLSSLDNFGEIEISFLFSPEPRWQNFIFLVMPNRETVPGLNFCSFFFFSLASKAKKSIKFFRYGPKNKNTASNCNIITIKKKTLVEHAHERTLFSRSFFLPKIKIRIRRTKLSCSRHSFLNTSRAEKSLRLEWFAKYVWTAMLFAVYFPFLWGWQVKGLELFPSSHSLSPHNFEICSLA